MLRGIILSSCIVYYSHFILVLISILLESIHTVMMRFALPLDYFLSERMLGAARKGIHAFRILRNSNIMADDMQVLIAHWQII
jgi:hypothetical protein